MALQKTKELDNGFSGDYWRIAEININFARRDSHVSLWLYKDLAARQAEKLPVWSTNFDWFGEDFPFNEDEPQNEREIAYSKITASRVEQVQVGENELGEPVYVEQETNFWVDALSC